jgi:hypothetical protein
VIHTDTTRRDVRSNHNGTLVCLELVKDPVTLVLLLVAVNGWEILVLSLDTSQVGW